MNEKKSCSQGLHTRTYLDQFKWEALVENSVDFCSTRKFDCADLRAAALDALLEVLAELSDHSEKGEGLNQKLDKQRSTLCHD